jgi:aromatic ring-opening dioxygenase LigB subunit
MGGIVFAAIAPHGSIAVAEACADGELDLAAATREAFEELGRRCAASGADVIAIVTPHNIHVEGAMAVVTASRLEGTAAGTNGRTIALKCGVDRDFALRLLAELREAHVPAVGVSFGGNRPEQAVMPMDWGTLIPLWHLGGRAQPPPQVVVVSPARDLSARAHIAAGAALALAAARSGKRVALVASADHGHAHEADGPYGYDPASPEYDSLVARAVAANRLGALVKLDPGLVERAAADSWWQLLVLHGALAEGWVPELLSYEAPSYYGMLCAAFTPA